MTEPAKKNSTQVLLKRNSPAMEEFWNVGPHLSPAAIASPAVAQVAE